MVVGEYTTGYVDGKASTSDKGAGVVALTMFDLRSRGKVGRVALCGTNGNKFPGIRAHMKRAIADAYDGIDIKCDTFPADGVVDPKSYLSALDTFQRGDAVTIFTPDDTHFEIAMACIERGLHVLVTKPIVKTLEQHQRLHRAAATHGVLVSVEVCDIYIYILMYSQQSLLGAQTMGPHVHRRERPHPGQPGPLLLHVFLYVTAEAAAGHL